MLKKQIANKEGYLNHKKGELEKIIADTEKEEKHFNKISEEAAKGMDERLLYSYDRIRKSYRNGLAVVPVKVMHAEVALTLFLHKSKVKSVNVKKS